MKIGIRFLNRFFSIPVVLIVVSVMLAVGTARGATVDFVDIYDAVDGKWFDPSTTAPDSGDRNILKIGLKDFFVSVTGGGDPKDSFSSALDTISFTILAPPGYAITKISYSEGGTATLEGTNVFTFATGSWTVDGIPETFTTAYNYSSATNAGWTLSIDEPFLVGDLKTVVPVTITNQITAVAINSGDSAFIEKVGPATLEVEIQAIPLPGAAWLLGSGLVGLIAWRRRNTKS